MKDHLASLGMTRVVSTSSSSAVVRFIEHDYLYNSVATLILDEAELAQICLPGDQTHAVYLTGRPFSCSGRFRAILMYYEV